MHAEKPSFRGMFKCDAVVSGSRKCTQSPIAGSRYCYHHAVRLGRGTWKERMNYQFKHPELQALFEKYANDPERLDLSQEMGLVRMCLQSIVSKVGNLKIEELNPEQLASITTFAEHVSEVGEKFARIEKMTDKLVPIDYFMIFTLEFVEFCFPFIPKDQHDAFRNKMLTVHIPTTTGKSIKESRKRLLKRTWRGSQQETDLRSKGLLPPEWDEEEEEEINEDCIGTKE
jgi:hypothetical protein